MKESVILFLTNTALIIGIAISINWLFVSESLYYYSYGSQISLDRVQELFGLMKHWILIGYIILPIIIIIRIFYTSIFLFIGAFFTELKIEFRELVKIVLLADFIYVLAGMAKLIILIFFKQIDTLADLQFSPLSILELLNEKNIDTLFNYPLSLLNVFEVGYFLSLAWLLVDVINRTNEEKHFKLGKSLKLVTVSYGSGLLLWVLVVMFITLNIA